MGVDLPRARRHRGHRWRRPDRPAGVPALEPGAGAPSGADHDCDLGHHRRPGARALQRRARVERHLARLDEPSHPTSAPRHRLLARAPGRADARAQCRARALGVALSHAHGDGHPRRRRRPPDDLGARAQHPADLRDCVRRRLVAGGLRWRRRRLPGRRCPGPGRAVAPELARRRDHRRARIAPRGGRRLACSTGSCSPSRRCTCRPPGTTAAPSTRSSSRSCCWLSSWRSARRGSSGDSRDARPEGADRAHDRDRRTPDRPRRAGDLQRVLDRRHPHAGADRGHRRRQHDLPRGLRRHDLPRPDDADGLGRFHDRQHGDDPRRRRVQGPDSRLGPDARVVPRAARNHGARAPVRRARGAQHRHLLPDDHADVVRGRVLLRRPGDGRLRVLRDRGDQPVHAAVHRRHRHRPEPALLHRPRRRRRRLRR